MSFLKLLTRNRKKAIHILLASQNKYELVNEKNKSGWTCVHQVAQDNDVKTLKILISYGAKVWELDDHDKYPLNIAVIETHIDIIRTLFTLEIPDHVILNLSEVSIDDHAISLCPFRSAFEQEDVELSRLLVDSFFHLFHYMNVKTLVLNSIERRSVEFIKSVFGNNEYALYVLRESKTLIQSLLSRNRLCVEKTRYILELGDINYPIDLNYSLYYLSEIWEDEECKIFKVLLDHQHKFIGLNNPKHMRYAIDYHNKFAVDLLLSLKTNIHKRTDNDMTCFFMILRKSFLFEDPRDLEILHKFLLYTHSNPEEKPRDSSIHELEYTRLKAFTSYIHDTVLHFIRNVSLFEIISYNLRLNSLQEELVAFYP